MSNRTVAISTPEARRKLPLLAAIKLVVMQSAALSGTFCEANSLSHDKCGGLVRGERQGCGTLKETTNGPRDSALSMIRLNMLRSSSKTLRPPHLRPPHLLKTAFGVQSFAFEVPSLMGGRVDRAHKKAKQN